MTPKFVLTPIAVEPNYKKPARLRKWKQGGWSRGRQVDFVLTKKWNQVSSLPDSPHILVTYLDCLDGILNLIDTTLRGEGVDPTIVGLFAKDREGLVRRYF